MNELTVMAIGIVFKYLSIIAAIAGVVYLANEEKKGWGWLIVLALVLSATTYHYTSDDDAEEEQNASIGN